VCASENIPPDIHDVNVTHTAPDESSLVREKISAIYHDILGREPDETGLEFYTNEILKNGKNLDWVRESLAASPEIQSTKAMFKFRFAFGLFLGLLILFSIWQGDRLLTRLDLLIPPDCLMNRLFSCITWTRFCMLCGLLYCIRGGMILAIYPPLEGPDEYQHIAYIEAILAHKFPPVYGQARVPAGLLSELIKLPHPEHGWRQIASSGCLSYKEFFDGNPRSFAEQSFSLYQAQHPPLYYYLSALPYQMLRHRFGFLSAVYGLRCINILISGIALVLLLIPIQSVIPHEGMARISALTISLIPNFLISNSRVANDGLALLFSSAVFYILIRHTEPLIKTHGIGIVLSLFIALGVLSKLTVLFILPASIVSIGCLVYDRVNMRRILSMIAVILIVYVCIAGPYHIWCKNNYNTFLSSQETLTTARIQHPFSGMSWKDHVDVVYQTIIRNSMIRNLWYSGWSFIDTDSGLRTIYGYLLAISCLGFLIRYKPDDGRSKTQIQVTNRVVRTYVIFIIFAMSIILAREYLFYSYHGITTGLPNYAIPIIPLLLTLIFRALLHYRSRFLFYSVLLLFMVNFIFTEWYSLFRIAAPFWADNADPVQILERLDRIHPGWLNYASFLILKPFYLVLLVFNILTLFFFFRGSSSDRSMN
jgi:hypothetical protein